MPFLNFRNSNGARRPIVMGSKRRGWTIACVPMLYLVTCIEFRVMDLESDEFKRFTSI